MARRRMIEVTIAHDKAFNSLSEFAQLLYLRTLPHTDDYGRFEADVDVFKVRVDPFNKRPIEDYEKAMKEIADVHLWSIYEIAPDKRVLQFDPQSFERINAFLIKSRGNCEYPAYMKAYELICGDMPAYHIKSIKKKDIREKKEEERKEKKENGCDFETVWSLYPNKVGKPAALKHFLATVKTEEDYSDIQKAMSNYLTCGRVKNGYIQNGSTWFNDWQGWINPSETMMKESPNGTGKKPHYKFDASKYPTLQGQVSDKGTVR
jgi:glucan-binding YG repeat protein